MAAVAAAAAAATASGLAALRQAAANACPSFELQAGGVHVAHAAGSPYKSWLTAPVHLPWLQDAAAQRLAAADELISNAPAMEELQALPSQAAEQLRSKLMPLLRKMAGLLQRVRAGRRYEQKTQHPPPDLSRA